MTKTNPNFKIIVHPNGDGFLGPLVPDFAAMLEEMIASSSSLGSKLSEKSYIGDVRRFNLWRGRRPITKNLINEYLKYLSTYHEKTDENGRIVPDRSGKPVIIRYSPAYVNRTLASLRWYVRKIKDLLDDDENLQALLPKEKRSEFRDRADRCLDAKAPRGSRPEGIQAGRYIPAEELKRVMAACLRDRTRAGARDRAMIALAGQIGPRVHEIAKLSLGDVVPKPGPSYEVQIIGKGNKARPVKLIIAKNTALYLRDWLAMRGGEPGALFCRISYKDRLVNLDRHLTPHSLHMILQKRLRQAGYKPQDRFTWHDFRRTVISDIIKSKGLVTAQMMAGHSSSSQTAKYDRLWQENVGDAILERPDIPYGLGAEA
jgi:integrase